ncbi:polyketide cyclase/dehydrase/lipid transport protein [Kribbella sp. VKM Ac-2571]|uniref:SRPBCC family protein n=1 Tax=Kribbella sp. VKM Ac-2571 TaxID=2512222 RepID=UPI00105C5B94|nr:SRPBCC family protein [Kribbella sp. VKM Ac-2571]TDO56072.1 polyketide cyclase/dehydrase/lipid transport protein [Kribbella sp. VKM Ac-2571]
MIVIQRDVSVATTPEHAFDYLADFRTTEEWDPGTVRTVLLQGDGGEGTTYRNTSRFKGRETELTYVVEEYARPDRIVLRGENRTIVSRDTMTFRSEGHLTRVTYRAEFQLKGLARLTEPFLRRSFERLGDEAEEGLRNALGRLAA